MSPNSGVEIKAIRPFSEKVAFSDLLIQVGADPEIKNRRSLSLEEIQNQYNFTRGDGFDQAS